MINYISKPFKWFFRLEAASGLVLLFAAVIALIISNSNLSALYFSTLDNDIKSGDYENSKKLLESIKGFQKKFGSNVLITENRVNAEILYNKLK